MSEQPCPKVKPTAKADHNNALMDKGVFVHLSADGKDLTLCAGAEHKQIILRGLAVIPCSPSQSAWVPPEGCNSSRPCADMEQAGKDAQQMQHAAEYEIGGSNLQFLCLALNAW